MGRVSTRSLESTSIFREARADSSYTYELCFFGKATQKSNKDHSSNNLGHFVEWNPAAKAGEYDYYTKMAFRNG